MKMIVGILFILAFSTVLVSSDVLANDFKDCTNLKEACFDIDHAPSSSFYIKAENSKKAAVLVHGLTDSAYFTKDLALLLNSQGYNVYSVLLSGHGTRVEDLFQVSNQIWLTDIKKTILFALKDSGASQVVLSGFSMGGVLTTSLTLSPIWTKYISNLILMAPAFKIKNNAGIAMCATGTYRLKTWAKNNPGKSPIRYNQMPFRSVCELTDIGSLVRDSANKISTPIFMAVTDGDTTIDTPVAIEVYNFMSSPDKNLFHIKNTKITHTDLVFKNDPIGHKNNPEFDQMSQKIIEFLK